MFRVIARACFAFVIAAAPIALTAPLPARATAAPPELPMLPEIDAIGGIARLSLTAAIDPSTGLPSFYYGGATTPPTIRVRPGDSIVIDYTNALPVETQEPLDFTNLHFHGLTVSPHQPGDQVIMVQIGPGQTYRYVVKVPPEQAPGLYWYHPHPHGESNRQLRTAGARTSRTRHHPARLLLRSVAKSVCARATTTRDSRGRSGRFGRVSAGL